VKQMLSEMETEDIHTDVAQQIVAEYQAGTEQTKTMNSDPNGIAHLVQVIAGSWVAIVFGQVKTNARLADKNLPLQIVFGAITNTMTTARSLVVGIYQSLWRTEEERADWDDTEGFMSNLWDEITNAKAPAFATAIVSLCYRVSIDPETGLDNLKRFDPLAQHVGYLNSAYKALAGEDGLKGSPADIHLGDYVGKDSEYAEMTLLEYFQSCIPTMKPVGQAQKIDHKKQGKSLLASLKKVTNG